MFGDMQDELLWAAAWLYKASSLPVFLQYVVKNSSLSYFMSEFSWDNKHAGLQVLLSNVCAPQFPKKNDCSFKLVSQHAQHISIDFITMTLPSLRC
jgi:hypothetical protein